MMRLHGRRGGFTLIELMIVVAIIGVLAAIAIPNFLRFQLRSRSAEGRINVQAIMTAEESFNAEFNLYRTGVLAPGPLPGDSQAQFTDPGGAGSNFSSIGWRPEGQVYFQYEVTTGCGSQCYFIGTQADIDGNGELQHWGYHAPQFILDGDGNVTTTNDAPAPPTVACVAGDLMNNVTGACAMEYGLSIF